MLHTLLFLGIVGITLADPIQSLEPRRFIPLGSDVSGIKSCTSLRNSCNKTTVDLNNFYSHVPCIVLTTCLQSDDKNPAQVLQLSGAPANQSRLTEETFHSMSGGKPYMTQQNYIDVYYGAISQTYDGTYPDDVTYVMGQWQAIAAWTNFCDTLEIPYSNFADWLEYSSVPGVCGAVSSCQQTTEVNVCVPQPITDNGSCAEMATQCQLWVTKGLFQNVHCVLASFCYARSDTDVLLRYLYPSDPSAPTTSQQARLSEAVFYNITGGAPTMSQKSVSDAYHKALTDTWTSKNGTLVETKNSGPYPTSPQYMIDTWAIISAWTGFCKTRDIPYANLADYLSYAAGSGYRPTC